MYVSVIEVEKETHFEKTALKDALLLKSTDINRKSAIIKSSECYMKKPLCKNIRNIDMNKTVKFGVCKCCWSGEQILLNICIVIEIYRHK